MASKFTTLVVRDLYKSKSGTTQVRLGVQAIADRKFLYVQIGKWTEGYPGTKYMVCLKPVEVEWLMDNLVTGSKFTKYGRTLEVRWLNINSTPFIELHQTLGSGERSVGVAVANLEALKTYLKRYLGIMHLNKEGTPLDTLIKNLDD
jgi:hypothetical protein